MTAREGRPGLPRRSRAGRQQAAGARSRKPRRARPLSRPKRIARVLALAVSALVLVTAGAGVLLYRHLSGNLHTASLSDGVGGSEKADAFGRTPIDLLVIGSDGRANAADCKLGGGCGSASSQPGANADVEMVVHISADRSNATVVSIPRDTMTQVPACGDSNGGGSTPGYYGMVNSALLYGPACQVATVHQLTGIPIDHFVELDFSGVVTMSDAVGGVPVCVSDNVYDTYSHLKLARGSHVLKGAAALEFLRSRHGFGDGGDLGRTYAQHLYLSALIRKLKSAGTLTDPAALYSLADAATKAMTVDTGLGSVAKLIGLATDVSKVEPKRITFTTMQTEVDPDNSNRLVIAPSAQGLFDSVRNDRPLTTADGGPVSASTTAATGATGATSAPATGSSADLARIAVRVRNGSGITGRASTVAAALVARGLGSQSTDSTGNAPSRSAGTTLSYGPGDAVAARAVASAVGLPASHLRQGGEAGITLVIGTDWPGGGSYPGGGSGSSSDARTALTGAHVQTADQAAVCAPVSQYKTVEINGTAMTPGQAYAYATAHGQPDSAP
ncbi:LCP family protein [Streptacidiphilus cavernicola]|uniref:LCP family protein n=1 Tax=Streptacidiphilus cavernicola TaxID=3342716 RepID=A0ABV6VN11_9ACTN